MNDPRVHFFRIINDTPGHSRRVFLWAAEQPGWVARAAAVAAMLVLTLIVLLLVIPALLIGILVFAVLSIYVYARLALVRWKAARPGGRGRRNVRVIRRDP